MTRDQVMRMSGESCPNDGTLMVRVTWRDEAESNREYAMALIADVLAATRADSLPAAIRRMFADGAPGADGAPA